MTSRKWARWRARKRFIMREVFWLQVHRMAARAYDAVFDWKGSPAVLPVRPRALAMIRWNAFAKAQGGSIWSRKEPPR